MANFKPEIQLYIKKNKYLKCCFTSLLKIYLSLEVLWEESDY